MWTLIHNFCLLPLASHHATMLFTGMSTFQCALLTCSGSNWVVPSRYTIVRTSTSACPAFSIICIFSSGFIFPESFTLGSDVRAAVRHTALDRLWGSLVLTPSWELLCRFVAPLDDSLHCSFTLFCLICWVCFGALGSVFIPCTVSVCERSALVCGTWANVSCSRKEVLSVALFHSDTPSSLVLSHDEQGGSHFWGRLVWQNLGGGFAFW